MGGGAPSTTTTPHYEKALQPPFLVAIFFFFLFQSAAAAVQLPKNVGSGKYGWYKKTGGVTYNCNNYCFQINFIRIKIDWKGKRLIRFMGE